MNHLLYNLAIFLIIFTTFFLAYDRNDISAWLWVYFSVITILVGYLYMNREDEVLFHLLVLSLICILNISILQTNKLTKTSCCETNLYYKTPDNTYVQDGNRTLCYNDVLCNCNNPDITEPFQSYASQFTNPVTSSETTSPEPVITQPTPVSTSAPVPPSTAQPCSAGLTVNQKGLTLTFQVLSGFTILLLGLSRKL